MQNAVANVDMEQHENLTKDHKRKILYCKWHWKLWLEGPARSITISEDAIKAARPSEICRQVEHEAKKSNVLPICDREQKKSTARKMAQMRDITNSQGLHVVLHEVVHPPKKQEESACIPGRRQQCSWHHPSVAETLKWKHHPLCLNDHAASPGIRTFDTLKTPGFSQLFK